MYGMGIWGVVGPAAGIAATGYALYRARQSEARGQIDTPIQRRCREATGSACSAAQIRDLCNNLSYGQLRNEFSECIPRVTAAHYFGLREGHTVSPEELALACEMEATLGQPRPRDCAAQIERQRRLAAVYPPGRPWGPPTAAETAEIASLKGAGMQGLGFSRVAERPVCDTVPDGEQYCFRTTTVAGRGPEQTFARNQGCLQLPSGPSCETSPYGNPGKTWCCPPNWPRDASAGPLRAGEFPPAPPGVMNKLKFWSQYWWFWGLALGVPAAGYLGYRYLEDAGYLGSADKFMFEEDLELQPY